MQRWLCLTILMAGLGMAGCGLTGKKSTTSTGPHTSAGSGSSLVRHDLPGGKGSTAELDSTMLAGRVVNSFGRPVSGATIRLVMVPEEVEGKPAGKPIETQMQPDRDGYFVIPNLKPDRDYIYIASARDGDVTVAVFGSARPPQPRMVLKLTEEMAKAMPDVPTMVKLVREGKQRSPVGKADPPAAILEPPQVPASLPTTSDRTPGWEAHIETPIPGKDAGPAPGSSRPAGYVTNPQTWPPSVKIESPVTRPEPEKQPIPPPMPSFESGVKHPSCDLDGNQLRSFSLRDMSGQLYEFRRDQHAKLVLLQFWHTTCPPCLQSIPWLKQWQSNYGGYGLEVIGICYEDRPFAEQLKRVQAVSEYQSIRGFNYPILLGGDANTCPVHKKLQVAAHPTFVLLDQTGHIVYHSDSHGFDGPGLEKIIRDRLGVR